MLSLVNAHDALRHALRPRPVWLTVMFEATSPLPTQLEAAIAVWNALTAGAQWIMNPKGIYCG